MGKKVYIPGELDSAEKGGFVTATSKIVDRVGNTEKTQRQVNNEVVAALVTIQQDINTLRGMAVVDVGLPPSTLTATPDNVYFWADNAVDVTITLTAPEDTSKVAVYSFFVKTGATAPTITFNKEQSYSLVVPEDWTIQADTWCEIEVMFVGSAYFVRAINY